MGRSCAAGAGYRPTSRRAGPFPLPGDFSRYHHPAVPLPPPPGTLAVYSAVDHSASQVSAFGKSFPVRIDFSNPLRALFPLSLWTHIHILCCGVPSFYRFFIDFLLCDRLHIDLSLFLYKTIMVFVPLAALNYFRCNWFIVKSTA